MGQPDGKDKVMARLQGTMEEVAQETRRRLGKVSIAELAKKGK